MECWEKPDGSRFMAEEVFKVILCMGIGHNFGGWVGLDCWVGKGARQTLASHLGTGNKQWLSRTGQLCSSEVGYKLLEKK